MNEAEERGKILQQEAEDLKQAIADKEKKTTEDLKTIGTFLGTIIGLAIATLVVFYAFHLGWYKSFIAAALILIMIKVNSIARKVSVLYEKV
jgi:uncharacterized membrane protein YgaE (UPF0421/DUF939 family)